MRKEFLRMDGEDMKKVTIGVLGTFDTKGEEYRYLIGKIRSLGADVLTIDASTRDRAAEKADYGCRELARYGEAEYEKLITGTRAESMAIVMTGAGRLIRELVEKKRIQGLLSIGGSGGTTIAASVMRTLPIGFPKVIATTQACSDKMPGFIGGKDFIVINSVADVQGTNSIISKVYDQAAGAVVGAAMAAEPFTGPHPPRIALSMYGITTPCVVRAAKYLERKGYEPVVFHANGAGGKAMKTLIAEGMFQGVLDITTAEVAAHVLDAESSTAGEDRLDAAVLAGIPQVLSVGGMDLVGIRVSELETKYKGYKPYCHNDKPDMIRTKPEDGLKIGKFMCGRLNNSYAPCAVYLPIRSLSALDEKGGFSCDDEARRLLYEAISLNAGPAVEIVEMDCDINAPEFAEAMAERLCRMLEVQDRKE